jgi:hypothetical protein
MSKIGRRRYLLNRNNILETEKSRRQETKRNVFEYYGGHCELCGETDFAKLSLDHIDGNGRQHRKDILGTDSGTSFYRWVLENGPDNLRILCYNCNCQINMTKIILTEAYEIGCKYCGSEEKYRDTRSCPKCHQINKRNKYIDLKLEVFSHYGNKCACCGIDKIECLTIDHINNNGAEHRKQIGTEIFPWLRKNNYPEDFQILCYNCNYAKQFSTCR